MTGEAGEPPQARRARRPRPAASGRIKRASDLLGLDPGDRARVLRK
jgi:hypothetical protein